MPLPLLIFSQLDYFIQVVHTNSNFNDKQCRSRSVDFFRSQLIWIYTVCKGRVYPGSVGQGLINTNYWSNLYISPWNAMWKPWPDCTNLQSALGLLYFCAFFLVPIYLVPNTNLSTCACAPYPVWTYNLTHLHVCSFELNALHAKNFSRLHF